MSLFSISIFEHVTIYNYLFLNMMNIRLIVVEDGGKTSAPAVTRRKDIGRMTVRPISFQRE